MASSVDQLLEQGLAHQQQERFAQAETLYRQALEIEPRNPETLMYLGILAYQTQRNPIGLDFFRQAVAAGPQHARAHYNLGNALDADGLLEDAVASFRRAIELNPAYANALMNLGNVLQTLGKHHEALVVFQKLIEITPNSAPAHHNLARLHDVMGSRVPALLEYMEAADLDRSVATLSNLSGFLRRIGDHAQALKIAQEAIDFDSKNALGWIVLGEAHETNGEKEEAAKAYRQAVAADPDNDKAAFFLALVENSTPPLAAPKYISQHYDGFAESFDAHLGKLAYRTPDEIFAAVNRVLALPDPTIQPPLDIFDAGCGTGLCGSLFAPLAKSLRGADLSPEMIRHAAKRNIYQELIVGDLSEELRRRPTAFDLILASDVLIHLGDLRHTFAAAAAALRPRGLFAFSVERHDAGPEDFTLLPTRRFAHSLPYLRRLANENGFVEKIAETTDLRKEAGQDVKGYLLVLQKN